MKFSYVLWVGSAIVALAQTPSMVERTFSFTNTLTVNDMQEIATAVRLVSEIPQATVDETRKTLTVRGSTDQVAFADWIFHEVDLAPSQANNLHEYHLPAGPGNVARVFFVQHAASTQDFQEIATVVRSIVGIRRLFTYERPHALLLRGDFAQMDQAAWLLAQLDQLPGKQPAAEYRIPGTADEAIQVFTLTQPVPVQSFQEIATLVRSLGDIRQLFTYNRSRMIVAHATGPQIALADWLIHELDQPAHAQQMASYRIASGTEDEVRVIYLPGSFSQAQFQDSVMNIREKTRTRKVFSYNAPHAMVLRGTAQQATQAEALAAALR